MYRGGVKRTAALSHRAVMHMPATPINHFINKLCRTDRYTFKTGSISCTSKHTRVLP